MWPFRKKAETLQEVPPSAKPSNEFIRGVVRDEVNIFNIPLQYVNWSFEYLNLPKRCKMYDPITPFDMWAICSACSNYYHNNRVDFK